MEKKKTVAEVHSEVTGLLNKMQEEAEEARRRQEQMGLKDSGANSIEEELAQGKFADLLMVGGGTSDKPLKFKVSPEEMFMAGELK